MQPFFTCSEPTSKGLSAGVHHVFYSFQTYLQIGVFAMSQSFFFSVWPVCFPRLTDNQTKAVGISLYLSLSFSLFLSHSLSPSLSLLFPLFISLSFCLSFFLSFSLSLSLAKHIASGQAQTRSLYISRQKFNRANMKVDRLIKTSRQLYDRNAVGSFLKPDP